MRERDQRACRGQITWRRRSTIGGGSDLIGERLALALGFVALWWLASLGAPHFILPGPPRVYEAFKLISATAICGAISPSRSKRVSVGFVLATLVSVPFGIVLGAVQPLGEFFEPVLPVLNTVSSAIWAIFAIIWFGISNATTIFVVFMTAMPLIITNVWQGTRSVNADFIELAHTLAHAGWKVMTENLSADDHALLFFRRAACLRFRLAREPRRRNAGRVERCRIPAAPGRRPDPDRPGICLDDHHDRMMATLEMGVLKPLENHMFRWKKDAEAQ